MPSHKRVRVMGSRTRANVPSIFHLQSKSRCGTGLSWPQGCSQLVPTTARLRLSHIHLRAAHNLSEVTYVNVKQFYHNN